MGTLLLLVVSSAIAAPVPGRYIVVLKDGVSETAASAQHARQGAKVFHHYKHALNGYAAEMTASQLAAVRADKRVLFVAKDGKLAAPEPPKKVICSDPSTVQCLPPNIDRIDADQSSTRSGDHHGSVPVNVAIIDTGIDIDHPDLNVVGGTACHTLHQQPATSFDDPFGHGTFVAGVVGARDNGVSEVGVVPGARLWAVRMILDADGFIPDSAFICGLDFVTSTRTDGDPSNDIVVANASLGSFEPEAGPADDGNCGRSNHDPLHLAYCRSTAAGVTHVVSAGNEEGPIDLASPAGYREVLAVTSMTDFDGKPGGKGSPGDTVFCEDEVAGFPVADDTASFFSNFARLAADRQHTLAASGFCAVSTLPLEACATPDNPHPPLCDGIASGTSFSSPAVAGTAALCIAIGRCTGRPEQVIQTLRSDAAAYNHAHPHYGFVGDPLRPLPHKYYGFLIRAGLY
jgi:subtilisin